MIISLSSRFIRLPSPKASGVEREERHDEGNYDDDEGPHVISLRNAYLKKTTSSLTIIVLLMIINLKIVTMDYCSLIGIT